MIWRVRRRRTFSELAAQGRRARQGPLRMTYLPAETRHPQLAMAIGRRFGNAVERNLGRRRVRAAFAEAWPTRAPALEGVFLVTGTRALLTMPFNRLVESMIGCFDQFESQAPAASTGPTAS